MNQRDFERLLHDEGFDDTRTIEYEPNFNSEMHTHAFSCRVLVLDGEFALATEKGTARYAPGDTCKLEAGMPHAEQAGTSGAKIFLGIKK